MSRLTISSLHTRGRVHTPRIENRLLELVAMLSLLAAAQFAFAPSAVASAVAPHAVAPHARVVVGESGLDAVSAAALPVINQLLSGGITVPDMTLPPNEDPSQ